MGIVTPHMRLPVVTREAGNMKQWIQLSIEKGVFTPFLGAGASSLRPRTIREASDTPWESVVERLAALWNGLEDEEERRYVESVAEGHGIQIPKRASNGPAREDESLHTLQIYLIKMGSLLTRLFGEQMVRRRASASDPEDYAVSLDEEVEEERKKICAFTLKAAEAARALAMGSAPPDCPPLRPEVIYRKLLVFCCRMCPRGDRGHCPPSDSSCFHHREEIESLRRQGMDLERRDYLRLDELAWFDNLLWYTLRYKVPSYPTTRELAFQVSLMTEATSVDFRMGPLAQVAEVRANYERQVKEIQEWFKYCQEKHAPAKLHRAIAAALEYQSLRYLKSPDDHLLSIAFTTNFDRLLEEAFESLGFDYHVVFPIYVRWPRQPTPVWVWRSKEKLRAGEWRQRDEACQATRPESEKINGPIIVKLHGSPLDELPDPDDLGLPSKYQHFVVLSESSYLEAIVGEVWKYPQWIQDLLKEGERYLWFLGYSISDWNIRLRLFEHLTFGDESLRPKEVFRLDVDHSYDPYKFAILGALGVTVCEADLAGLAEMMDLPEVRSILA